MVKSVEAGSTASLGRTSCNLSVVSDLKTARTPSGVRVVVVGSGEAVRTDL